MWIMCDMLCWCCMFVVVGVVMLFVDLCLLLC